MPLFLSCHQEKGHCLVSQAEVEKLIMEKKNGFEGVFCIGNLGFDQEKLEIPLETLFAVLDIQWFVFNVSRVAA